MEGVIDHTNNDQPIRNILVIVIMDNLVAMVDREDVASNCTWLFMAIKVYFLLLTLNLFHSEVLDL